MVRPGQILPAEPSSALITALFNEGKAAMVFSGPWFLGEIADERRLRPRAAAHVDEAGGKPMRPWMTVEGVYIAAPSKNKDAAYDFVQYLTDVAGRQGAGARRPADARPTRRSTTTRRWRPIRSSRPSASRSRRAVPMPNCRDDDGLVAGHDGDEHHREEGGDTPKAALDQAQKEVVDRIVEAAEVDMSR